MRNFPGIFILFMAFVPSCFLAGAEDAPAPEGNLIIRGASAETEGEIIVEPVDDRQLWQSTSKMDKAKFFHQEGNYALAEQNYVEILESNVGKEQKKEVLLNLAEVYHESGADAKAVDMLENCLRLFPDMSDKPEVLFRLGEFYRDLGLQEDSIGMFYQVLNSIVVTGESNLKRYLNLARLAQFEIARSHYDQEEYDRAFMLFDRIDLLELEPEDREIVSYYKSLALLKSGENEKALEHLQDFVDTYPTSELRPEMLYLTAEVLYRLNRSEASAEALLKLLEISGDPSGIGGEKWTFWRQQAGNRLANRFYGEGNFLVALRIYQGMVHLEEKPSWQLPIVYQIGLCFEKLYMYDRARQTYTYIEEELDKIDGDRLPQSLFPIVEGVGWRMDVLDWRAQMEEKLETVVTKDGLPLSRGNPDS